MFKYDLARRVLIPLNNYSQLDMVAVSDTLFMFTPGLIGHVSRAGDGPSLDSGLRTCPPCFHFSRRNRSRMHFLGRGFS